jgi:P2 family phage contractile tail tube protein
MSLPRKIRNYNAFLDGISYFGRTTEAKLPVVKINTEAHRGGGMDGPVGVDVGTEGMSAELTFADHPPEVLKQLGKQVRLVLRPAAKGEDGTVDTIIATIGGLMTTNEPGDLKPGNDTPLKVMVDVRYYRLEMNGEVIYDIDLVAGKRVIGGEDQLAAMRAAMGI